MSISVYTPPLITLRTRRLHKKAGSRYKKFTQTATTYYAPTNSALFTRITRNIHLTKCARLPTRHFIYIASYAASPQRHQPIWVEKQALSLARKKKLLKVYKCYIHFQSIDTSLYTFFALHVIDPQIKLHLF